MNKLLEAIDDLEKFTIDEDDSKEFDEYEYIDDSEDEEYESLVCDNAKSNPEVADAIKTILPITDNLNDILQNSIDPDAEGDMVDVNTAIENLGVIDNVEEVKKAIMTILSHIWIRSNVPETWNWCGSTVTSKDFPGEDKVTAIDTSEYEFDYGFYNIATDAAEIMTDLELEA